MRRQWRHVFLKTIYGKTGKPVLVKKSLEKPDEPVERS